MLRLLQTSDLHLGARAVDLGEAGATLRDRRLAAFDRTLALALSEKVNVFLIVGDLFDSNNVTRGLVGRVATGLAGLAGAGIKTVIIPDENEKDLAEIPDNVKLGMTIIPVKTVGEVLKVALVRQPEPIDWVEPAEVVPAAALAAGDGDAVMTH